MAVMAASRLLLDICCVRLRWFDQRQTAHARQTKELTS